jgi:hypothetical protein
VATFATPYRFDQIGQELVHSLATTLHLPNLRLVGLNSTTVPVPVRLTVCGLPGALSVIDNVPVGDGNEVRENFLGEKTSPYVPVKWPVGAKGSFAPRFQIPCGPCATNKR